MDTRREVARILGRWQIRSPRHLILLGLCVASAALLTLAAARFSQLDPAGLRMLFILCLAAALWVSEAIPAFAVGLLIIALEIWMLGQPGGVYARTQDDWSEFASTLGHPLIWLFFGGFVMAEAAAKTGLDRLAAMRLLSWIGSSPPRLLAGIMAATFTFSMFMSNTATTAVMLAAAAPLAARLEKGDPFRKALLLCVPVSANLGGMGSLIGTPPNAIAASVLGAFPGQDIDFLQWMMLGLPVGLALLAAAWIFLTRLYPCRADRISAAHGQKFEFDPVAEARLEEVPKWQRFMVLATSTATILLWMSGQWHGVPTTVVSFLPITVFTAGGVLRAKEVRALPWDVLLLLSGSMALGLGVEKTGLSEWLVAGLPLQGLGLVGVSLAMAYGCLALSNFMSNTAAANILIPVGVAMLPGIEAAIAVPIALGASAAMCLPISTPPNAIAYSGGQLDSKDFLRSGLLLGAAAPGLAVLWLHLALDWVLAVN